MQRLLLLWPDCSSWFQIVLPGTETTTVPVSQICCNYFSHLSSCSESRALLCNINSLPAKQEVICLLIGQIPAVCGSVLSAGRPCGNTRVFESDRGRMQADHFSLCQFLVLWYQSISLHACACVCVYNLFSLVFCKIEFCAPDLHLTKVM